MIDTLKASRTLKKNGFNDNQADAIIEIVSSQEQDLATKGDINLLREHTATGFDTLRTEVSIGMDSLRREMGVIRWMVGISITISLAVLIALITMLLT